MLAELLVIDVPEAEVLAKDLVAGAIEQLQRSPRKRLFPPRAVPVSPVMDEGYKWAVLDLNQRPPRCQRGALAN